MKEIKDFFEEIEKLEIAQGIENGWVIPIIPFSKKEFLDMLCI